MTAAQVSIIVPVYQRAAWLEKCLTGLANQDTSDSYEVVVVDDGSPNGDEIVAVVDKMKANLRAPLQFFRKPNGGPAAARNFGARYSRGEVLCFVDDDSVPSTEWLRELVAPFRAGAAPAVISGRTCSFDRSSHLPLLLENSVYAGKTWATCNIAYHREVYESLGGFDETFPEPSWEDNDLGLRAHWAGYAHIYSDKAVVFHPHESSLAEYRDKCLLNGRGAAVFSRKYMFRKPLWSIATPIIMSRRLLYGLLPSVWSSGRITGPYVKFLWSYYSLLGFVSAIFRKKAWKKPDASKS